MLLLVTHTHKTQEKKMKTFVKNIKECDGAFWEDVAMYSFAAVMLLVMSASVAQI